MVYINFESTCNAVLFDVESAIDTWWVTVLILQLFTILFNRFDGNRSIHIIQIEKKNHEGKFIDLHLLPKSAPELDNNDSSRGI